jgi:hypothetical protein
MFAATVPKRTAFVNKARFAAYATAAPLKKQTPSLTFAFEPFYRVILLYSGWSENNEKEMAYRVHKSVPIVPFKSAKTIVQRTRIEGRCIIVTVVKDDAMLYLSNLKAKGFDVMLDEA